MKKLMITAALVVTIASLGYSQERPERPRGEGDRKARVEGQQRQPRTPEQRAQMATDALEKKLGLTAEQKTKVYALNLERAEKMEKTMKSEREFRKDQMEKHKSLMEESDKKLSKILTDEQRKSYEDMKKQSRDRMKARRPQAGPRNRVK
ncbi:EMC3/TMCO1 family protein [Daejeonella lutea]|nr:hypothetical protein [Daejeonella lutea]